MNRLLLIAVLGLFACASIEGTFDHSATSLRRPMPEVGLDSLAILPIRPSADADGMAERLAASLERALSREFPGAHVVGSDQFAQALAAKPGYLQYFANWRNVYEQTAVLEAKPLPRIAAAVGARFFLNVRATDLEREKIRATDTGRTGWVSNASQVWRTRLKILAELIDTRTGSVVWRGTGAAENINSPRKDIDLGLMIVHQRNPEVDTFLEEMFDTAAEGTARQIAGASR